jgi:hypothetical protein
MAPSYSADILIFIEERKRKDLLLCQLENSLYAILKIFLEKALGLLSWVAWKHFKVFKI